MFSLGLSNSCSAENITSTSISALWQIKTVPQASEERQTLLNFLDLDGNT